MTNRMCVVVTLTLGLWCGGVSGQDKDFTRPIVEKAIQALGGPDKQKLHGITFDSQAKFTQGNINIEFSGAWSAQGFDKVHASINGNTNGLQKSVVLVMNGMQVWGKDDTNKVEAAPAQILPYIQSMFRAIRFAQRPGLLAHQDIKLSPLGELPVNNVPCVGVKVEQKEFKDLSLFFDKATGLPAKAEFQFLGNPNAGEMTLKFLFSEYKETDGVKHFTGVTVELDQQKTFAIQLSNFRPVAEVNANLFMKP